MSDPIKAMSRGIAAAFALLDRESDIPDPTVDRPDFSTMFVPMAEHAREQLKAEGFEIVRWWQPIETAPKDGTEILVSVTYSIGGGQWETLQWVDWCVDQTRWTIYRERIDIPAAPTHWMPLPTPPKGEDHG